MSKITFNIHNKMTYQRDYSASEKSKVTDDLNKLNPEYVFIMDYPDLALEQSVKYNRKIIYRSHHEKDGDIHNAFTAEDYYTKYVKPYADKGYIIQVYNEPKQLNYDWLTRIMDIAGYNNHKLCVFNSGSGTPDVDRLDDYSPLWNSLDKWKDNHYLGIHEYGSELGFIFNDSTKYDVTPWHIGRTNRFVLPYLIEKYHAIPDILITEFGVDDIYPGNGFKRFWQSMFDEITYSNLVIDCIKENYLHPAYKAVCLSFYGNTGTLGSSQDWSKADHSHMTHGIDMFAGFNRSLAANGDTIPVEPIPTKPKPEPGKEDNTTDSLKMVTVKSNDGKIAYDVGVTNAGLIVINPYTKITF